MINACHFCYLTEKTIERDDQHRQTGKAEEAAAFGLFGVILMYFFGSYDLFRLEETADEKQHKFSLESIFSFAIVSDSGFVQKTFTHG